MKITTTTDLKAIRSLVFNTTHEAAEFLGFKDSDALLQAERGRRWTIQGDHADKLLALFNSIDDFVETKVSSGDRFLLVYQNDDVFREFEPEWSAAIPTANIHFKAVALAMFAMGEDAPTLVTLNPTSYEEFRDGRPDTPSMRQTWAAHYAQQYKIRRD